MYWLSPWTYFLSTIIYITASSDGISNLNYTFGGAVYWIVEKNGSLIDHEAECKKIGLYHCRTKSSFTGTTGMWKRRRPFLTITLIIGYLSEAEAEGAVNHNPLHIYTVYTSVQNDACFYFQMAGNSLISKEKANLTNSNLFAMKTIFRKSFFIKSHQKHRVSFFLDACFFHVLML